MQGRSQVVAGQSGAFGVIFFTQKCVSDRKQAVQKGRAVKLVNEAKKQAILSAIAQKHPGRERATIYRIQMQHGSCTLLCPGGVAIEKAVTSALSRFGEDRVLVIDPQ